MKSETVHTSDIATSGGRALVVRRAFVLGWALVVGWGLSGIQPLAGQVSQMNFFVVIQGPTWGAALPPVGAPGMARPADRRAVTVRRKPSGK